MANEISAFMNRFMQEGLCGMALYLIGFYVIFYLLQNYLNPKSKDYRVAVYVLGFLVLLYLIVFVVRNTAQVKNSF